MSARSNSLLRNKVRSWCKNLVVIGELEAEEAFALREIFALSNMNTIKPLFWVGIEAQLVGMGGVKEARCHAPAWILS